MVKIICDIGNIQNEVVYSQKIPSTPSHTPYEVPIFFHELLKGIEFGLENLGAILLRFVGVQSIEFWDKTYLFT